MKKIINFLLIALSVLVLNSCSNLAPVNGYVTLKLPGITKADRAAYTLDQVEYTITIKEQDNSVEEEQTGKSGETVTLELNPGTYTFTINGYVKIEDDSTKLVYTGSVSDVVISAGETTKTNIDLHVVWEGKAEKVEFDVKAGSVKYGTKVTLTTKTKDAKIYYTTDGSDPATSNTKVEYKEPVVIKKTLTIKAYAVTDKTDPSEVTSAEYTILKNKPGVTVEMPEQITKGDLVMEVMGNAEITLTVKSLSGKAINSCSWLINGVPAKNETTSGMITQEDPNTGEPTEVWGTISVITINENTIILDLSSNIFSTSTDYHIRTSSDKNPNNILSCIAEFEDGNMEDISYTFTCGA